jgi:hypothetical protein
VVGNTFGFALITVNNQAHFFFRLPMLFQPLPPLSPGWGVESFNSFIGLHGEAIPAINLF